MNNRKVTLKDIAEKTGFSINTISLALKGQRVSEETRKLIVETAEDMGYIGNALASSMRSGLTGTIAIIVGDIANPYFSAIIDVYKRQRKDRDRKVWRGDKAYESRAWFSAVLQR